MRFTQLLIAAGTASLALAARLKSKTKRTSVFQCKGLMCINGSFTDFYRSWLQ